MLGRTKSQRALVHRLNGQLLESLHQQLSFVLKEDWILEDWIINILMLNRSVEQAYTARMESSSTFYKGTLFKSWKDCDTEQGVGGLDFEAPLDLSFSGYCIQTGDSVWLEDVTKILDDPKHPLREFYRRFEHVAVLPDADIPTGEYIFPILVRVGLLHMVLGVLNMEYFAKGTPFAKYGQLKLSNLIMKLLYAHSPFLLLADLPEMADLVSKELIDGEELLEPSPDAPTADVWLLKLHRRALDTRYEYLKKEQQQ